MNKWKCTRCGQNGTVSFDSHECVGKPNLNKLSADLLLKVINKELTEQEAWDQYNKGL